MMKRFVWRAAVAVLSGMGLLAVLTACSFFPQPPVADFVVLYNVTEDLMVVDLDASLSSDPNDDAIVSYMWVIDDEVHFINPLASSSQTVSTPVLRVRFPDEGDYVIQLLVVDETGAMSPIVSQTVTLPNIPMNPTQYAPTLQ